MMREKHVLNDLKRKRKRTSECGQEVSFLLKEEMPYHLLQQKVDDDGVLPSPEKC